MRISSHFGRLAQRSAISVALFACIFVGAAAMAQSEGTWSLEEYQALSAEVAEADAAREESAMGSEAHQLESERALRERRALVALIDGAIRDGSMPAEFVRPAEDARVVLIQNIVVLLSDLERCAEADAAFALFSDAASEDLAQARTSASRSLEQCHRVESARNEERERLAAETPAETAPAEFTEPSPARPRPALASGILFGLSAGATVGLAVWHSGNQQALDQASARFDAVRSLGSDQVSAEAYNATVAAAQSAEDDRNLSLGLTIGAGAVSATLLAVTIARAVGRPDAVATAGARLRPTAQGFALTW